MYICHDIQFGEDCQTQSPHIEETEVDCRKSKEAHQQQPDAQPLHPLTLLCVSLCIPRGCSLLLCPLSSVSTLSSILLLLLLPLSWVLVVLSVQQTCRQSTGTTDGWAHNHTLCFFCDKLRLLLLQMGNQETREGRRELPNAQTRNNPSYMLATVTVERNLVSGVDPIFKQASLLLLPWVASSHQSWDCGWDDHKARVHKEISGLVSAERQRQSGERCCTCGLAYNPDNLTVQCEACKNWLHSWL